MNTRTASEIESRQARKQRTRQALLDSALDLLEDQSLGALSLREVARGAGVVPTAFYRHFGSMEELGLALIEDSFSSLREMIREARSEPAPERVIRRSAEIVVSHVRDHRSHFRFITRERQGGVGAIRQAIRTEIRLIRSELATDLTRFPYLSGWSTEDLNMMAGLLVNAMVSIVEEVLDAPIESPRAEGEIIDVAEKQLRLIALGVPRWKGRES